MHLLPRQNFPIGLDISETALKAVQLTREGHNARVVALNRIALPKGTVENGSIVNKESFAEQLRLLLGKAVYGDFSSNEVIACLPEATSFIKLIPVEKTPNPIATVIGAEIEKYIPYTQNDLYFDYQVVGEHDDGFEVLIGAAARTTVRNYLEALSLAGLTPAALEVESQALCRALLSEESPRFAGPPDRTYCIIDIGAKRTSLTIYSKRTIVLSVSLPISSNAVSDRIAAALEINWEQAEKAKIVCGLDQDRAQGIVNDILTGMVTDLKQHLSDSITFYYDHYAQRGPIDQIILSGGGASIKDLGKTINAAVNIDTVPGNIFTNLKQEPEVMSALNTPLTGSKGKTGTEPIAANQQQSLGFAVAVGLALRGPNLN